MLRVGATIRKSSASTRLNPDFNASR